MKQYKKGTWRLSQVPFLCLIGLFWLGNASFITASPAHATSTATAVTSTTDNSRSVLEKLRKTDPSFPLPIKFGSSKQAGACFVVAEVEAWLESEISESDGGTQYFAGRENQ